MKTRLTFLALRIVACQPEHGGDRHLQSPGSIYLNMYALSGDYYVLSGMRSVPPSIMPRSEAVNGEANTLFQKQCERTRKRMALKSGPIPILWTVKSFAAPGPGFDPCRSPPPPSPSKKTKTQ